MQTCALWRVVHKPYNPQTMANTPAIPTASATQPSVSGVAVPDADVDWVPVLAPEDLPKGALHNPLAMPALHNVAAC